MSDIKRKLATVEMISSIKPIEGADAIELAEVRGWKVVIKKGEFREGDLCIYCEIDSVLPERPEFEFLRPRNFRIRTIKLRGQISQGIAFPLTVLPVGHSLAAANGELQPGYDVTDILGVKKYDPPIPAELGGKVRGRFPSHSIKTDEERIQNLIDSYEEYKKMTWDVTEKLDGSSMTAYINEEGNFGIASRNLDLKESETNSFWKTARDIDLEEKMRNYMESNSIRSLTIQGELIGEGIQKNKYRIKGQRVYFFRAFSQREYKFYSYDDFLDMMRDMDLDTVPILERGFYLPEKYEDLILYADGRSKLYDTAREGIVLVSKDRAEENNGRLSFKVISNKFILKHEE